MEERLTVAEVARLCSMSESAIKKTFTRYAGIGMMAYFNQMKMRRAARLMEEGMSVRQGRCCGGIFGSELFQHGFQEDNGGGAPHLYGAQGTYLNSKILSPKSYRNVFLDMVKVKI